MLGTKTASGELVAYSWWKVAAALKSRRGAVMTAKVVGRVGCVHAGRWGCGSCWVCM